MNKASAILIVEDDPDVLRAARIALAPYFDHIESARGTEDVESQLTGVDFDAVLLDMNFALGEHSGKEGMDGLKKISALDPTLSVVLMTAYGAVALAVEALKQGAVDFVLKPWRNDRLIAAIELAVNTTRSRRADQNLQLVAVERKAIKQALARHEGNISATAAALGLSRAALYRRMSKHGL